jgi:hypothetical protein
MTGVIYSNEVLRYALRNSISSMGMEIEDALIIEDLDSKHSLRCKISESTAEAIGYNIVQDYPPCSPDLNPLENIWGLLKTKVSKRSPSSMEQLEQFAMEEWVKIEIEQRDVIESLIDSFPRRLEAVIENNGWYTKY